MKIGDNFRCDFCNAKISRQDRTELLDGDICPKCFKKLSPWFSPLFSDFTWADIKEIRTQLELREENRKQFSKFHPTRRFGDEMMIVVDDDHSYFVVTDSHSLKKANPDILSLKEVSSCSVYVDKNKKETGSGRRIYQYQFQVEIKLRDHPYLSKIEFNLNEEPLEYETSAKSFLGFGGFDPEDEPEYAELQKLADKIENVMDGSDRRKDDEYAVKKGEFDLDSEEEKEDTGDEDIETKSSDNPDVFVEGKVVTCPWCGSKTILTRSFRCEHCGGTL